MALRKFNTAILLLLSGVLIGNKHKHVTAFYPSCSLQYFAPGDIMLGGIFSLFTNSETPCDRTGGNLESKGVFQAEAMRFAIEEINNRTDVLPHVKLGMHIVDDGWSERVALGHTLDFLEESDCLQDTRVNVSSPRVVGIVGLSRSATTIPSARVAELFNTPLISYFASSDELADRTQFPYFLRTIPPDGLQTGAIVDLLSHYSWNYIGLIHSIDSYGIHGARQLQLQLDARDICVAFVVSVSDSASEKELREVTNRLIEFDKAKTIVMFSSGKIANIVLEHVKYVALDREINWVGGDDWGFDLYNQGFGDITKGAIFTRFYSINIAPFENYVRALEFKNSSLSPWIREYWKENIANSNCLDFESCSWDLPDDFSATFITLPVIDAVYVYAHGLHSLLTDKCGDENSTCQQLMSREITGKELFEHLRGVRFDSYGGLFQFDDDSNPPGKYILRNWQKSNETYQYVEIGKWESYSNGSSLLTLQQNQVLFSNGTSIPKSICQMECKPGEIIVPLAQKCCSGCQECKDKNYIVINDTTCKECPVGMWPDVNSANYCIPIIPTNIPWNHSIVLVIISVSVVGIGFSSAIIAAMLWYRERRIIKAAGRELSAINFAGIILSFMTPFVLLLPPTTATCISVDALISVCFTLIYVSTLLKVNRIFRIFNASKSSVRRPSMLGPKDQLTMATILIAVQVWLFFLFLVILLKLRLSTSPVCYIFICSYNLHQVIPCSLHLHIDRRL